MQPDSQQMNLLDCRVNNLGPVLVYNAAFERKRIEELAATFPDLADDLLAINERIVDLLPITREHYY